MLRTAIAFVAGAVVMAAALGGVLALSGGEAEVRIGARQLDDGRVEVAVQQRGEDGWSETQLPNARFLRTDAEPGRWYWSNGVAISASDADLSVAAPAPEPELFCLVTHGRPGDEAFWVDLFETGANVWDARQPGYDVMVKHGATPDQQAAMIRECVADGASVIGSSLGDPDALRDALLEASEAGVLIASFNSGLQDYESVNSLRHVSIDEVAAGQRVAELLHEPDVSGDVLCVLHEERNIGLVERCEGIEEGYANGQVERLYVTGVGDLAATTEEIAERLRAEDASSFGAVITLNTEIGLAAIDAIDEAGADVVLATFDQTLEVLNAIVAGDMLFAINTNPALQAFYSLASMEFLINAEATLRQRFGVGVPLDVIGNAQIYIGTKIYTAENAAAWLQFMRSIRQGQGGQNP